MSDFPDPKHEDLYAGIPPEVVVMAMEKVSQRFQFCDLENPIVQSIQQMSLIREAKSMMKGESTSW